MKGIISICNNSEDKNSDFDETAYFLKLFYV